VTWSRSRLCSAPRWIRHSSSEHREPLLVQVLYRGLDQIEAGREVVEHRATRDPGLARDVLGGGIGVSKLVEAGDGRVEDRGAGHLALGLLPGLRRFGDVGRHGAVRLW